MSAILRERFIAVNPSMIRTFGLTEAVVVQELYFASLDVYVGGEEGQTRMSYAEIADRIGISKDAAYRAIKSAMGRGTVRVEADSATSKRSYVVDVERVEELVSLSPDDGDNCRASARALSRQRESTIAPARKIGSHIEEVEEAEENYPPNPPAEQGGQDGATVVSLFDGTQPDAAPRKPAPTTSEQVRAIQFAEWWAEYPTRAEPDGPTGQRGSKQAAERAWGRALKGGGRVKTAATVAELEQALRNYLDARRQAAELFGGWPPLMHASTFLGQRRLEWETPLEGPDDERLGWWERVCRGKAREAQSAAGGGWVTPESGPLAGVTEQELNDFARQILAMESETA